MRNRIDPIERGKAQSLQAVYQRSEGEQTVKKIFQPPAFLKKLRDDDKYCEKRENYATLNSFKPRFEPRIKREAVSGSKKFRVRQRYEPRQMGTNQPEDEVEKVQQRLERIIERELRQFREENRVFFNPDSEELKKQLLIKSPNHSIEQQNSMSPYAKFSANVFPKKQLKALTTKQKSLYPGRDDYFSDLDRKFRQSLKQKIVDLQNRLGKPPEEMLQVMTIYSIKQQAPPMQKKKKPFFQIPKNREKSLPHQPIRQDSQDKQFEKLYQRKLYSYLAFLQKVNFSNNLPIRSLILSQKFGGQKIKVFVGNGNNKFLLVSLLKRRFWLEITNKIGPDTKFIWTQNSIKQAHSSQKTYNQYLISQSDEEKMIEQQNIKQFKAKFNSIKKFMIQTNPQQSILLVQKPASIKSMTLLQQSQDKATSTEADSPIKTVLKLKVKKIPIQQDNKKLFINMKKAIQAERNIKHFKVDVKKQWEGYNQDKMFLITNHIPQNSFIGSKKALFYTMEHYYRQIKKINPFTIIPKTYHFKTPNDEAYSEFLEQQKQREEKSIWIVKPGECTNRGNGIAIMRANDVTRKLLKKDYHWNGQLKTTIVQSYLTDPFLYNGRKFDIRHYMLISIVNGNLKAYWYSQGYIRTSSQSFTLSDLNNRFVHLTNDAVQKQSFNYGKYQPGNKLSYSELQRYLDCTMQKKVNFKEQVLGKMKEIATDVVKANYLNLGKQRKMNNFELFGLDFMLDKKLSPWLIEINANPCLQTSCPLLSRLIPLMLQHTLRLALDPQLIPPAHYPPNLRYYLPQNFLNKLNYHLIFDELQYTSDQNISLNYDFDFDQPEDEYENDGIEMDVGKILD